MIKIQIAFDVDGTLRVNTTPENKIVANRRIVRLWETLSTFKNVELHLWSSRGPEYCREVAKILDLQKCKGFHMKEWGMLGFIPDIAIDDQQEFDGGIYNLIVREK